MKTCLRRLFMVLFAFLAYGCQAQSLPVEVVPPSGPVSTGWVEFNDTFQIQDSWDALDDLADSEAQCASNGWRLPTSEEWRVVITAGYQGVRPVFYQEWWRDQPGNGPGAWGVIGGGQGQSTGAYAYRCAQSVTQ